MKMVLTMTKIHAKVDHIHQINDSNGPSHSGEENTMKDMLPRARNEDKSDMVLSIL